MDAFEIADVIAQQTASDRAYLEFLRVPALSMGLYVLPAGGVDPQQPHQEDEVYYVINGRGMITVGDEDRPVEPGSIVFVGAGVEHRFHSISEELKLLVFFAPAESS
ncbi:MAG TPA: cupin domain-containing protein [Anaerolineae bacterium]